MPENLGVKFILFRLPRSVTLNGGMVMPHGMTLLVWTEIHHKI